jgi:phosphoribosylformylglycinamidine synthase
MRSAIIVFPGSNCDIDLYKALNVLSKKDSLLVWHKENSLPSKIDIVFLPGGFSFGDYLRCGSIAAHSPIMRSIIKFARGGGYIIGICNGFQILTESKLLPGALIRNNSLRFICRDELIQVQTSDSVFTNSFKNKELINLPIAHHDGNYFATEDLIKLLLDKDQIAFKYRNNPNGSTLDIAGVLSSNRRVLGMMPHPERSIRSFQNSRDGVKFFTSIINSLS